MKKMLLTVISGISFSIVFAQTDTIIGLDNFRLPTTPAAAILNLGTQSIARPTTPKGVSTALLSGLGLGNSNGMSPNMNLELAPYWLTSRRKLTFAQYYHLGDDNVNVGENIMQTLAISIATSRMGDNKDTLPGTRLGLGIRTQLLSGKISPQTRQEIRKIDLKFKSYDVVHTALSAMKRIQDPEWDDIVNNNADYTKATTTAIQVVVKQLLNKPSAKLSADEIAEVSEMVDEYLLIIEEIATSIKGIDALKKLQEMVLDKSEFARQLQKVKESDKNKIGLFCEFALAGIQYMPDNSFSNSSFQKGGAWVTVTYRTPNQKNEFALLARHSFSNNDSVNINTDIGISATRIVDKGFNYGLELVYRGYSYRYLTKDFLGNDIRAIKSGSTYRLNLNMEYKLSEVVALTASIGKDFDSPFTIKNNFSSIIGANFSLPALIRLTHF